MFNDAHPAQPDRLSPRLPAASSPSGLRAASPAQRRASALADRWAGLPEGITRWRLAAALRAAARPLGLSGGMLRLLEHYVDLSYDQDWAADSEPVICRPLVEIAEALSLGERQVRNLERALLERGLIAFRDSGNHHRRGRRDRRTGRLVYAYGPSLAPLGPRAAEILAMADAARAEIAAARRLRLAISALRRRVKADLAAAPACGVDAADLAATFADTPERTPAGLGLPALERRRDALSVIAEALAGRFGASCPDDLKQYPQGPVPVSDSHDFMVESDGQPAMNRRHIPDTTNFHAMNGFSIAVKQQSDGAGDAASGRSTRPGPPTRGHDHGLGSVPLALALAAAGPLIGGAACGDGPPSWRSLVEAARRATLSLGIDQDLWGALCGRLGRGGAALAAIIVERGLTRRPGDATAPIRAPAAYLRAMLERADAGVLHLDRSIRALAARSSPADHGARGDRCFTDGPVMA